MGRFNSALDCEIMKRIAQILAYGYTAEILSMVGCAFAIAGFNRPHAIILLPSMLICAVSLLPLVVFGRDRYCITGLMIFTFSSVGIIAVIAAFVILMIKSAV